MKKPILAVYADKIEGERPKVYWEFGGNMNCWFLIGILESIKLELLETIEMESAEG